MEQNYLSHITIANASSPNTKGASEKTRIQIGSDLNEKVVSFTGSPVLVLRHFILNDAHHLCKYLIDRLACRINNCCIRGDRQG